MNEIISKILIFLCLITILTDLLFIVKIKRICKEIESITANCEHFVESMEENND